MTDYDDDDHAPRLSRKRTIWVVARDRRDGYVCLGGLGVMGCGEMWFEDNGFYKDDPDYENAPERSSVGGFGRLEFIQK